MPNRLQGASYSLDATVAHINGARGNSKPGASPPEIPHPESMAWDCIHVPPFPQVALRVLECVNNDAISMCRLTDIISSDPALCSEVLIVANSPLMPFRFPVTSILQALARLGTYTLRGLCLTVAVRSYLGKSMNYPAIRAVWQHSLATALIASKLSDVGLLDSDDVHTAGILHEIGRFALSVLFPSSYAQLLGSHLGTPESMREIEREMFGLDHAEVGHRMIDGWALPAGFHAVIGHASHEHEAPADMSGLIDMSCQMAGLAGFPAFAGCELPSFDELRAPLTLRQQALFYPDQKSLASDIGWRIAGYESI